MGITSEQVDQYKLEYVAVKAVKAKMTSDHLSVWKDGYDQNIYIYVYIYIYIYNHDHKECIVIVINNWYVWRQTNPSEYEQTTTE